MNYKQISATSQIKSGAGKLQLILTSSTSSGTFTVYDSPDGNITDPLIIATVTPAAGSLLDFLDGLWFNHGCYIVVTNTIELTVGYE